MVKTKTKYKNDDDDTLNGYMYEINLSKPHLTIFLLLALCVSLNRKIKKIKIKNDTTTSILQTNKHYIIIFISFFHIKDHPTQNPFSLLFLLFFFLVKCRIYKAFKTFTFLLYLHKYRVPYFIIHAFLLFVFYENNCKAKTN